MNETDTVQEGRTVDVVHTVQKGDDRNRANMDTLRISNNSSGARDTAPRHPQQIKKRPVRFKNNALSRTRDVDEPTVNKALTSNDPIA